jgi:opacity protein-like surface antigen
MKKWLMAAAVAVAGLAGADARAQAPAYVQGQGSCQNGECAAPAPAPAPAPYGAYGGGGGGKGHGKHWTKGGFLGLFGGGVISEMPTLPVYMAAPWYLYWPYDGHFQTIAPMAHGLYYPPPVYTGNPYLAGAYAGYISNNPIPSFPVTPVKP